MRSFAAYGLAALALTLAAGVGTADAATPARKAAAKPAAASHSGRASLPVRSADPYMGAIVIDAATGQTLFEKNADQPGYPASVIKLVDMFVILDRIAAGQVSLSNVVTVTAESSRIGGSQVYLKEHETFPVEDLLYALMVQSANDAAMALAIHVGGSASGFVDLMNAKAAELKLSTMHFHSVHGLPPAAGQEGDEASARDLASLARELLQKHPEILQYTSTKERPLQGAREKPFIMRNHNHLLSSYPGCDGFKTGLITAGGYSIVATAQRDSRRVIAVVLGSKDRLVRDAQARELMSKGFAALPPLPPPPPPAPVVTNAVIVPEPAGAIETPRGKGLTWLAVGAGVVIGAVLVGLAVWMVRRGDRSPL